MNRLLRGAQCVTVAITFTWLAGGTNSGWAAVRIVAPTAASAGKLLDAQLLVNPAAGGASDGLNSLGGFDNGTVALFFDPDVFEVPSGTSVQLSSLLPAPFNAQPSVALGSISLAIVYTAALPDSTPLGVVAFGTLRVKPQVRVGLTEVVLRFDFNGGAIDFDPTFNPLGRTFRVSQRVQIVPEQSTWLMLLICLLAIGLMPRVGATTASQPFGVQRCG